MNYVKRVHEHLGHETDAWKLAHLLDLPVRIGLTNTLIGRTIFLKREDFYSARAQKIIRHEIGHHIIRLSGGEDEILYLQGSYEEGLPTLENLCYHAELILRVPEPMLWRAHAELGNTPAAIVRMAELSGAPVVDALYRWVYAEVGGQRAAWIIRGCTVIEVAKSGDDWLPFWRLAEVPDVLEEIPNALLYPLCERETLGVVSW